MKWNKGLKILVFGLISSSGPECLEWYEVPLNANKYQEILMNEMIKMRILIKKMIHSCRIIPVSIYSKSTITFLENNNIQLVGWSRKGADLNPLEKIWAEIKGFLYENKSSLRTKEDVWMQAQQFFFSMKLSLMIQKFYSTQHEKIQQLELIKGQRL